MVGEGDLHDAGLGGNVGPGARSGHDGLRRYGGNFLLGKANVATTISKLTASISAPALQLVNTSTGAAATALNLTVA